MKNKKLYLSDLAESLLLASVKAGKELDGILTTKCIMEASDFIDKLETKLNNI